MYRDVLAMRDTAVENALAPYIEAPEEGMRAIILVLFDFPVTHPREAALLHTLEAAKKGEQWRDPDLDKALRTLEEILGRWSGPLMMAGQLRSLPLSVLVALLVTSTSALAEEWLGNPESSARAQAGEALATALWQALRPPDVPSSHSARRRSVPTKQTEMSV